jgi:hypothetical protein
VGDPLSFPPYAVNNAGWRRPLGSNTIAMPALHYNGWSMVRRRMGRMGRCPLLLPAGLVE